jgi:hypothetical protein
VSSKVLDASFRQRVLKAFPAAVYFASALSSDHRTYAV